MKPRTKDERIKQYAQHCINFNGVQHDACMADVCYDNVKDETKTLKDGRFPCLYPPHDRCSKYEATGHARAEKEEEDFNELYINVRAARTLLLDAMEGKRGEVVAIECPVCKAELRGVQAGNGHVSARCATADCLNWME